MRVRCEACSHDVEPVVVFSSDSHTVSERCPRGECRAVFRTDALAVPPIAPPPAPALERGTAKKMVRAAVAAAAQPSLATERDLIKAARRQLRELDREVARLRKLEIERDKIKRLLEAADGALAVVKPIPGRELGVKERRSSTP